MVEALAFRSTEPPRHIHHREDEGWYVLDGAMTVHVGDDVFEAKTGGFVLAPMGVPHAFTIDLEPTRVLVFASPAGFERFADELGEAATSDARRPDSPSLVRRCSVLSRSDTGSRLWGHRSASVLPVKPQA